MANWRLLKGWTLTACLLLHDSNCPSTFFLVEIFRGFGAFDAHFTLAASLLLYTLYRLALYRGTV